MSSLIQNIHAMAQQFQKQMDHWLAEGVSHASQWHQKIREGSQEYEVQSTRDNGIWKVQGRLNQQSFKMEAPWPMKGNQEIVFEWTDDQGGWKKKTLTPSEAWDWEAVPQALRPMVERVGSWMNNALGKGVPGANESMESKESKAQDSCQDLEKTQSHEKEGESDQKNQAQDDKKAQFLEPKEAATYRIVRQNGPDLVFQGERVGSVKTTRMGVLIQSPWFEFELFKSKGGKLILKTVKKKIGMGFEETVEVKAEVFITTKELHSSLENKFSWDMARQIVSRLRLESDDVEYID